MEARGDPDDPFNGSANGVYQPLLAKFSLPLPVQTPRRQESSECRESSQNSQKMERKVQRAMDKDPNSQQMEPKTQMQVARCKSEGHSLESLDPRSSSNNRVNLRIQSQRRPQEEMINQSGTATD